MALTLYRRHRLECEAGHREDSRSGEWEERRKGWKRCDCVIHLSGMLDGKFSRKASGASEWLEAWEIADSYEKVNSWTGRSKIEPAALDPALARPRVTVADACKSFVTTKNGGDVFAYIPDWLRDRLLGRAQPFGERPFIVARSERLETVTNIWRRRIAKAFAAAEPFEEPATPHRFRHTFARILLQKGVPVADVADLLGDDEKTVRVHYARWVPERQERLTRILKDAFSDRPKQAAIQGDRR